MNSDFNNAKSFVSFLRKQKCIIPEIFITKYYNLTRILDKMYNNIT